MATITNFVRWATNTEELKSQLASGTNQIVAMKEAVDKTARSLGGEGLLKAAHNTTAAVLQMGGASQLTAAEQARVNTQLEKAIEKYRVMGKEPPAAMLALARETAGANQSTSAWSDTLSGLGTMLAQIVGPAALGAMLKQIISYGSALADAADRTGIAVESLQRLEEVAAVGGASLDQITAAVNQMQNRLAEGDKSAVGAVQALGMSVEAFMALSPDQQFLEIGKALQQVEDPAERVRIAMDLFGRQGAQLLPALLTDTNNLAGGMVRLGADGAKALDDVDDAFALFWLNVKRGGALGLGTLMDLSSWGEQRGKRLRDELRALAEDFGLLAIQVPKVKPPLLEGAKALEAYGLSAREQKEIEQEVAEQLKASNAAREKAAAAQKQFTDSVTNITPYTTLASAYDALGQRVVTLVGLMPALESNINRVTLAILAAGDGALRAGVPVMAFGVMIGQQLGVELDKSTFSLNSWIGTLAQLPVKGEKIAQSFGQKFLGGLKGSLGGLNDIFQRAFEGGGGVKGAIQSFATNALKGLLSAIPVIGPIVSQFAGAIVGFFKKIFGGPSAEVLKARDDLEKFKESLRSTATEAQKLEASLSGWTDTNAALFLIQVRDAFLAVGKTAAEAEALVAQAFNTDNPEAMKAAIAEINRVMDQYKDKTEAAKQAQEALKSSLAGLGNDLKGMFDQALQFTGLLPPAFQEMVKLAKQAGGEFRAMAQDFKVAMGEAMADNLAKLVDQFEVLSKNGIKPTTDQLQMMMSSAVAAFQTMIRNGADFLSVVQQLGPSVKDIQALLKAAGLEGTDAFKDILHWTNLVNDKIKGPLIQAAQLLNQQLTLMANNGQLNQKRFNDMTGSVTDLFEQMKKSGMSQQDILRAMQPNLQTIWELQQKYGFEVDATTQKLINQAKRQGLIGEEFKSTEEVMTSGILRIVQLLEVWLKQLGIEIPKAIEDIPDIDVKVIVDDTQFRNFLREWNKNRKGGPPIASDMFANSFAGGSGGLRDFGSGTLAMLHGREAVVTEDQVREGAVAGAAGSPNLTAAVARLEASVRRLERNQTRGLRQELFYAVRDGMAQRRTGRR